MAPPIPSSEPTQFVAGDTVQWTKSIADYPPSDGWTLKYVLTTAALKVSKTATSSNNVYAITLAASDTAALVAGGTARLIGWVDNAGGERHAIHNAFVQLLPNVATAAFSDLQTHEEKVLATIQATIEGRATADMKEYSIGDRHVVKMSPDELLKWQGIYKAKVWKQRNRRKSHPTHATRFREPGGSTMTERQWDGQQ